MGAPSTQVKNFQGGVVRGSDGTGTPVTLNFPLTQGDYSLGPLEEHLNERVVYTARTVVVGLGRGAPSRPKGKLTALCGNLVGGTTSAPGSMLEFATRKGAYAANVSTLGASREYTFDLRLTIEGTAWGDSADETVDCEDVVASVNFEERGEGNMLTLEWETLGSVVVTNNSNTVTYAQAA